MADGGAVQSVVSQGAGVPPLAAVSEARGGEYRCLHRAGEGAAVVCIRIEASDMPTRNVNLTEDLDRFVEREVESGRFENASEVVQKALQLLKEEESYED